MHRLNTVVVATCMFVLASLSIPRSAEAQNPVQLPTDANLSAYIGSTANYLSGSSGQTGPQTMAAWAAAFSPNEAYDFSALVERAFLQLGLPDDPNWGGILTCQDANLTIQINVVDAQNRLGSVALYENDSGRLVGTLTSSPGGHLCQGTFQNDSTIRDYRAVIASAGGTTLATLAVDLGKWDTVVWFQTPGGFEPYCPSPIPCTRYTPATPADYYRVVGGPISAPGLKTYPNTGGYGSAGCATLDVNNDSSGAVTRSAPGPYESYIKKDVAADTVNFGAFKVADPAAATALSTLVSSLIQKDTTLALGQATFPPYSTGYGYWRVVFTGSATAINAVPFEQVRQGGVLSALVNAINGVLQPATDFRSQIVKAAGNDYLNDAAHRQATHFKQGAVMSLGDIYVVTAQQAAAEARALAPIYAPVTFQYCLDIPPTTGAGQANVVPDGAATTPSPPTYSQGGGPLNFSSPGWTATMNLPKGWKWKVSGIVASPAQAYDAVSQPVSFQSPWAQTVSINFTLTKLLTLKVYTQNSAGQNAQGKVTIKNGQGTALCTDWPSYPTGDGRYVCTFGYGLPPGPYTVEVKAYSPPPGSAATTGISVNRGILQEVTARMGP